jgi:putative exporter of polyketide antibiotics
MVTILVLMAGVSTIQSLSKLRSDEVGGRLEPTLARPVSRGG